MSKGQIKAAKATIELSLVATFTVFLFGGLGMLLI